MPHRILLLLLASLGLASAAELTLASPDGRIGFLLTDKGRLEISISFKDKPVIQPSPLGITLDGVNLSEGAQTGAVERYRVNEKYPWYGVHSTAVDDCNGARVAVKHARTPYSLDIRAYNDGIAFRHLVPGEGRRVPDEATVFRVPDRSTVWIHGMEDHYEGFFVRKSLLAVGAGQWAAPPLTIRLPEGAGYASITEGGLANYSGVVLQADGAGGFAARLGHAVPPSYPFRLRYKDDEARMAKPAALTGAFNTPWRVVMIGADLNALVNCDIVHNVAPPPDPKLFPDGLKTSWIKPGRAVWAYLDGGAGTLEGQKEFSKLAAELGFEYNILEGYWSRWPESQLKELVDYSRKLGVGIILWKHSNGLLTPETRHAFFEICRRTGAVGAKVDFFDHEAKEVIDRYHALLKEGAEYKLVFDFHGANKPAGESRTYPNELTREGVRGLETGPPRAQHDATLPFTRMLAGHADYTPTHFGRKLSDTTWAHQVADAVILTSPLLVYGAHPANLLANPMAEIIKSIPSVWDETVALPASDIGEVAAFARRKGDTWFVAVVNGPDARTIPIDLAFLGSGSYTAVLARDAGEAAAVKMEHRTITARDPLYVDLRSGGGFVARFKK